jgi:hypothetical protein
MWRRHALIPLFAEAIHQLRLPEGWSVVCLVVGSEGERSRQLCETQGLLYLEAPNEPLGQKFNAGLRHLRAYEPDYVMVLGDDDWVCPDWLRGYQDAMTAGVEVIGVRDFYFYHVLSHRLVYWPGYGQMLPGETIGAGRMLSKSVLDRLRWRGWDPEKNQGLDISMTLRLQETPHRSHSFSLKEQGLFAMDIKTPVNINSFRFLRQQFQDLVEEDPEALFSLYLSEAQQQQIVLLRQSIQKYQAKQGLQQHEPKT